ncbi:hypothetical protein [uncultured Fibrella sp.]|uniref:hypothetical protein n=1 Tax=uncultured Fibrella sp. TaxID=1284596 RepID=UPI0035CA07CA
MKTLLKVSMIFGIMLIINTLLGCGTNVENIATAKASNSGAKLITPRLRTDTRYTFFPDTYVSVYNQSSAPLTVTFYYNNSTSSTNGWVEVKTITIPPRQDGGYCKIGVKQLKAVITFDTNSGTYQFIYGKKYSCN